MGEEITADPDAMQAMADSLGLALDGIGSELANLTAMLDLLATQWTGAANQAYTAAQGDWNDGMDEMHGILDRAVSALRACATEYEATERAIVAVST